MSAGGPVLLAYFGGATVRRLVEALHSRLSSAVKTEIARIQPARQRKYWVWFLLSLLPGVAVEIQSSVSDLAPYALVVLGFPKWNFNCPPVTGYVNSLRNVEGKKFLLVVSYSRGFGVNWYVERLAARLREKGGEVCGAWTVSLNALDVEKLVSDIEARVSQVVSVNRG